MRGVILNAAFFVSYCERAFLGPVNAMPFALSRTFARPKRSSRDDGALVLGIGLFPYSILRMSQGSGQAMVDRVEQGSALEVVQHAD